MIIINQKGRKERKIGIVAKREIKIKAMSVNYLVHSLELEAQNYHVSLVHKTPKQKNG